MKNYKALLELALLQLKEHSENKLIVQGDTTLDIDETLKHIQDTRHISQVDEAKRLLESKGYYLGNLWQVDDVKYKFDCTDEQAYEVLDDALQNDATMEQIWYAINFHAEDNGLELKEEY